MVESGDGKGKGCTDWKILNVHGQRTSHVGRREIPTYTGSVISRTWWRRRQLADKDWVRRTNCWPDHACVTTVPAYCERVQLGSEESRDSVRWVAACFQLHKLPESTHLHSRLVEAGPCHRGVPICKSFFRNPGFFSPSLAILASPNLQQGTFGAATRPVSLPCRPQGAFGRQQRHGARAMLGFPAVCLWTARPAREENDPAMRPMPVHIPVFISSGDFWKGQPCRPNMGNTFSEPVALTPQPR